MKRKLIIYISILIVLIAGYNILTMLPEKTEEVTVFKLFDGFEINDVSIENSYGKYSIAYEQSSQETDNSTERKYITLLSAISSELRLEPDRLNDFGLINPVCEVTLTDKEGEMKTLLIGDLISDKTGRYVMTDKIYVVSNEYINWLLEGEDIFKDRVLYSEPSPRKVEFNGICFEIIEGVWQMTKPYCHSVRGAELNTEVLENLHFTAVEFTEKSPAECGLDTPKGYISVWNSEDVKTTINLGDESEGLIYAMLDGGNDICRINIPGFLEKKPKFFLNTLCYVKNIDEIDVIQVNGIVFDVSEYKKNETFIGKEKFIEFYKKLMGMTLIDEAINPVKDKLLLRMNVNFKNGTSDTVEVYQYKERYGAVFINGECTFYTLAKTAEEIALQAENL